ncbi:MAG: hypothetical protein RSE15_04795 [Flavobacterium sp.]|uniref:hypothetical protein n=1 Tax=Flavobacterium sp. TaxID=239 RepID=UPI002B4960EB|nr:hypothetical protein [Flavobacterium sp.]WRH74147.1 MAG: hypothetical protein RSE15_04795 [Flavobacterium sp.]
MYSEEIIQSLTERIGFGSPQEDSFTLTISEAIQIGASGRVFKSFHSLVTLENIIAAVENINPTAVEFIAILDELKKGAVLESLSLILDSHEDYINDDSYDASITQNISLFDNVIGYKVAIMVIEMFMTTKRNNIVERNAKLSVSNLKLELEGYRNETGFLVAKGLVHKFENAIKTAQKKIFPFKIIVQDGNAW